MEPTSTTGLSVFTTRFRKYAVSSMVSVPWVITNPSTLGASSLMRLASFSMMSKLMSWEPTLEICSPFTVASSLMPGTACSMASMVTAPDV